MKELELCKSSLHKKENKNEWTLYNKKAIDQYSFLKENFLVILGKTLNFFHRIFIVCSLISIPYFIYKKKSII